jgi:hypothetical protein
LLVEPFVPPDLYVTGNLRAVFVDEPDLKIARMNVSRQVGDVALVDFHYLVATKRSGIERHFERHELGLFTQQQYFNAFAAAGLEFEALSDVAFAFERGLYLGRRPSRHA